MVAVNQILSMPFSLYSASKPQRCVKERCVPANGPHTKTLLTDIVQLAELIHNSEGKEDIPSCSVEVWFREIIDLVCLDALTR